ncbi:MAG: hypothetical protein ACLPYS_13820 [Vulcanimicrobiaceae bacterium]
MLIALALILASTAPASGAVTIVNSGSTNMAGYTLRALPNGDVSTGEGANAERHVAPALTQRLFRDLQAAGALDRMSATSCMKSASFGSWTRLTYRGATSPDLSCPSTSPALRALAADAAAITDAAGIRPTLRRRFPVP